MSPEKLAMWQLKIFLSASPKVTTKNLIYWSVAINQNFWFLDLLTLENKIMF